MVLKMKIVVLKVKMKMRVETLWKKLKTCSKTEYDNEDDKIQLMLFQERMKMRLVS